MSHTAALMGLLDRCNTAPIIPSLRRLNGFGCIVAGWLREPVIQPSEFAVLWFTVLFVPVLPLGFYIVQRLPDRRVKFVARARAVDMISVYGWRAAWLVLGSVVEVLAILVVALAILLAAVWITGRR